jgi:hypothetical protein
MNYELFLWIGVFVAVLAVQIYVLGVRMSQPEKMIRRTSLSPLQQTAIDAYNEWLASVQMEHRTTFQFGTITVTVYQQRDQPRYLSFMFHKRLSWCVESYLEDLTILDTTNSGSPDLFPRPGAYKQNFPLVSVQDIWQRHVEGEAWLSARFGYKWMPINRPYEEILADAMRIRMKHNRAQSFWPFRVLYRYAITGRRHMNQPITQQYPLPGTVAPVS